MTAREWPLAKRLDRVTITHGRDAGRTGRVERDQIDAEGLLYVLPDSYGGTPLDVVRLKRGSVRIHGVDVDLTPAQRRIMTAWAKLGDTPAARWTVYKSLLALKLIRGGPYGLELTEAGKVWCRRNVPDGKIQ